MTFLLPVRRCLYWRSQFRGQGYGGNACEGGAGSDTNISGAVILCLQSLMLWSLFPSDSDSVLPTCLQFIGDSFLSLIGYLKANKQ